MRGLNMNTGALPAKKSRGRGAWLVARLAVIAAALCLAAASCSGPAAPTASSPQVNALSVKSCTVAGLTARCGTLIVPEDRLTGKGRTIPVRFVVIPATSPDRAPDPVVWFAGGPGDSAVNEIPGERAALGNLNVHRDLVFIEQRGTGSSNPLTCPLFRGSLADKPPLRASVASCLAHLHGDLRFYTTAMYADDVNQVLGALHYATANFVGISYGTAAEQVFLLRHPGRVRTMTLISGTPLNVPLWERGPGNAQLALNYVFARCAADPSCHRAFPNLAADWAALWASLGRSPWVIPASRSPTNKTERVGQDDLASLAHNALYEGNLGPIPVVVHTLATAKDKVAALLAVHSTFEASSGSRVIQMMQYPVMCGEPWASYRPQALSDQRASFEYRTDLQSAQLWQYLCTLIPKSPAAVGQQQLTVSQVPVLAFNGEADPQDPPRIMAGIQKFWPNSRALALPGQGHNTNASWGVCAGPLTQTFIEQASVAHLDTGCLAALPAPSFAVNP
jgi:pimeloyl-ACP methyl ester carboxylesterase